MVSSLDSRVEGQQGAGLQLASLRRKTVELLQSNDASAAVVHARMSLDFQEQRPELEEVVAVPADHLASQSIA